MSNIEQFLSQIGLSDKEITVYLASLRFDLQPVSVIAKKVNLPRSTVKFTLEQLVTKGLLTKTSKEKVVYYGPIDTNLMEHFLLDKVAHYKKLINDFKQVSTMINAIKRQGALMPTVRYFEGYEGLCRMLDDFAAKDQTVLYISGHNMMHPSIRQYVYDVYIPISNTHVNKNKIILNEGEKAREYSKKAKNAYDEFIFVDPKAFPFKLTVAIYNDKVAFWSYDPNDMTGAIIQNVLIADQMRIMYDVMRRYFSSSKTGS